MVEPKGTVAPGETSPVLSKNKSVMEVALGTAETLKLAGPVAMAYSPTTKAPESSTGTVTVAPMLGTVKAEVVMANPFCPAVPLVPGLPVGETSAPKEMTVAAATSPVNPKNIAVIWNELSTDTIWKLAGAAIMMFWPATKDAVLLNWIWTFAPIVGTVKFWVTKAKAEFPEIPGTETKGAHILMSRNISLEFAVGKWKITACRNRNII